MKTMKRKGKVIERETKKELHTASHPLSHLARLLSGDEYVGRMKTNWEVER